MRQLVGILIARALQSMQRFVNSVVPAATGLHKRAVMPVAGCMRLRSVHMSEVFVIAVVRVAMGAAMLFPPVRQNIQAAINTMTAPEASWK